MQNFNDFFGQLSRAGNAASAASSSSAPAPAPAPASSSFTPMSAATITTSTSSNFVTARRTTSSASPTSSSISMSSSSVGDAAGSSNEEGASGLVAALEVNKPTFTFTAPSEDSSSTPTPQCTPIAIYNTAAPYGTGRLIAVSDNYICYAIKDGHIRGINRQSVQRTLLKGHKKPVIDMAFASKRTCVLASLGGDGSFYLWTIVEAPGTNSLTSVPLLTITDVHLQRVVWHPTKPHVLAAVAPNGEVLLINTTQLIEKLGGTPGGGGPAPVLAATGVADLLPEWRFPAHVTQCLDLSFSQDGKYLVTGGADGWARAWDVENRNTVARWQPYGGEPVTRTLFLHRTKGSSSGEKVFIVTGGKQDSEVKLWRAWTTLTPINTQTLSFEEGSDGKGKAFHLDADESGEFLMLVDTQRPLLYVAHVVLAPSSAKVDRLTPFRLKHPVLSLISLPGVAMDAHEGHADRTGQAEVQLYCVQTQAIQIYHLKPEECSTGPFLPAGGGGAEAKFSSSSTTTTTTMAAATTSASSEEKQPQQQPQQQQPAILQMLFQASQAAGRTGGAGAGAGAGAGTGAGGILSPQSLATTNGSSTTGRRGDTEASTQSVAAAVSEEKQTGGAHTTEEKGFESTSTGAGTGASTAGGLGGLGSRTGSASRFSTTTGGAGEGSSGVGGGGGGSASGQASRDAGGVVAVPPPIPSLATTTSATAGGGGGGGSVNNDAVFARLEAMEERLGRLVVQSTKQAVTEALGGGFGAELSKKVDVAIKAAVASQLGSVPAQVREAAVSGLGDAVKEPVTTSFKQCFQEMLIPAMQNTTQRMFAQMNEALNKNLAAAAAAGGGGAGGAGGAASSAGLLEVKGDVREVRSQVASLVGAVGALSAQLEVFGNRLESSDGLAGLGLGGSLGGGGGKSTAMKDMAPSTPPITSSFKEELKRDLRAQRFNEAFQRALAAADLDLVTWLCSEAPRDDIFDMDPPLLSQTILLCLMQQLSFNLSQQTGLKLEWLKQMCLAFNPADPEVASFVGNVLGQLQDNLEVAVAEVVALGDQERVKDFKFVQRAVKSMVARSGGR